MKKEKLQSKNPAIKNDYQMNLEIAEKIIAIIESGDVQQWRKTWTTTAGGTIHEIYNQVLEGTVAVNAYTLKQYDSLFIPSGFYVTFKQIKDKKLHLTKGAKGQPNYKPCSFYKNLTVLEQAALDKEMENKEELKEEIKALIEGKIYSLKVAFKYTDDKGNEREFNEILEWNKKQQKFIYMKFQYVLEYLFKAEDCGLNIEELWKISDENPKPINEKTRIQKVEKVKDSYIDRAHLKYSEINQDKAYYSPGSHSVVIPTKNQFDTIEDYYQTMLHEFAHSTGHPTLLNRKTLTASCGFGSVTYSKEELVAELSSLYTMISLKLMTDNLLKNSIAYLKSWGRGLKEGIKHNIISTISQSRKATNLILNISEDERKDASL